MGVLLYVSKGQCSITYLNVAAEDIVHDGRPCYVYEFGDCDTSGVDIWWNLERKPSKYVDQV